MGDEFTEAGSDDWVVSVDGVSQQTAKTEARAKKAAIELALSSAGVVSYQHTRSITINQIAVTPLADEWVVLVDGVTNQTVATEDLARTAAQTLVSADPARAVSFERNYIVDVKKK